MKRISVIVCVFLLLAIVPAAMAADYPTKPVRLIVTFAAGGGTDLVARAWANATEKHLGQSITVVNRVGGSGAVGFTEASQARADGYTLVMLTVDLVYLPKMGLAQVTTEDFEPIACGNQDNSILFVREDSRFKNAKELLDEARANPGQINYAVGGSTINFYAISLGTGVKFNRVTYGGAAETMPALLGGHVDVTAMNPGEAFPQIQSGQVRVLAIGSDQCHPKLPDVPTFAELGHPLIAGTWRGIGVPKGTPVEIRNKLEEAFLKGAAEPEFVDFMNNRALGIRVMNSAEFNEFISQQNESIAAIVEEIKKETAAEQKN